LPAFDAMRFRSMVVTAERTSNRGLGRPKQDPGHGSPIGVRVAVAAHRDEVPH